MSRSSKCSGKFSAAARLAALGAIAVYRAAISPLIHALNGPACRFEPSCSKFAEDALREHGLIRGAILTAARLARCNPLGGHGFDPVPPTNLPNKSRNT